ncbi:hypothetical protein [Anaeroplasma bactoclasticum]|jgi:hypothetical protein|nr:hypothetical protein [Anaeroplasma bactoclasticum]
MSYSNTKLGKALKGSKHWIQEYINTPLLTKELNEKIEFQNIEWISPLEKDNYREYSSLKGLKRKDLYLDKLDNKKIWPTGRMPQWDAIGIVGNDLILVEAKAHVEEIYSKMSGIDEQRKKYIEDLFGKINLNKYYQIANRIVVSKNLNQYYIDNELPNRVTLIFIYFLNDNTLSPNYKKDRLSFEEALDKINKEINYKNKYDNVKIILLDVGNK